MVVAIGASCTANTEVPPLFRLLDTKLFSRGKSQSDFDGSESNSKARKYGDGPSQRAKHAQSHGSNSVYHDSQPSAARHMTENVNIHELDSPPLKSPLAVSNPTNLELSSEENGRYQNMLSAILNQAPGKHHTREQHSTPLL